MFDTEKFDSQLKLDGKIVRPDFKLSDTVFVETDGLYWHSDMNKNRWHHFKRREAFEKEGFRLFQIREDELVEKPEVVKSILSYAVGKTNNRVFARVCDFTDKLDRFFVSNHLMGDSPAKVLGLCKVGVVYAAMSYKVIKDELHVIRFCNKLGWVVPGGFSRLLSKIEKLTEPKRVINFVDLRYGNGKHLLNKGFVLEKVTLGWKWTDGFTTFNRLKCRANMDERKLTQAQHAEELKWYKIHDAGQAKFVKQVN